ncbi:MAG: single-stranded-DNA-specific exonuclease RecJ [Anaerolineales bacterium]|jgi:single-stranded-DNA-specific exonuclease|nr:single-stranded-DNA-specific exonuclease RecJ [Anaerolineales bacterium]MDX9938187.1 single-stranded-DNA-specific exonuclease RecJ [Anaerolineales bacterium]GER80723.1 single-stranded-DNA-specific exonuclease RecJ [Candidatus Denitrolinea symbiosum]
MTRWLDPPILDIPAAFADLPPLLARTLVRRGLTDVSAARAFLHPEELPPTPYPNLERAPDGSSRGGIDAAVARVNLAARRGETICVWGDFDVDGQTSTALLVQTLRGIGAKVVYYIPIRGKESHGVHVESLKPIIDNGATLVVTCDTGVTAHAAIDYANSRGVDVVVTDHHDLGETLPNATAVVNPKMLPEDHPLANLAGVGVAYKLAEALLNAEGGRQNADNTELLDLVALGLIADVALLKGETRSLAQRGIQKLRETKRLGLRVMADLAGASMDTLTEETIGFTFAPRLNALGRLGDANPAVELLLTSDPPRARVLAAQIEGLNAQRRMLTSQVHASAEAKLRAEPALLDGPVIVLSHPDWPGGVVGIVANKLAERYRKPAILLSESDDGILRGSARSVEGLHITEAIASQKEILLGFGGHPMAAGMSLEAPKLAEFRRGLGKAVEGQLGSKVREEAELQIDAWVALDEVTLELADQLESLAPFGAGNPELTLATRGVVFKSATEIGKTKEHLRLNVEDENGTAQSLLWWGGAGEALPEAGSKIDVAYSLRGSSFRGQRQANLQFQAFRVVEEAPVEIREQRAEVRDWRLQTLNIERLTPNVLVWAEGEERSRGRSRFELHQADEFAIYTTPPSPAELRKALEVVNPKTVYVFAQSPAETKPEEFLSRLAGLCKYALKALEGKTKVQDLAGAMASRESAVQVGLEWLAAGGHLSVTVEEDDVALSNEKREKNPYLQAELFVALRGILNETSAYRKYFATVENVGGLLK